MRALIIIAALALGGCGSSQGREKSAAPEDPEKPETEEEAPAISEEERILLEHQARQNEACDAMCTRLTECAIADTEENAPETLEGVDREALARHYKETKCLSPCETSKLSVRQVETMEGCNEAGGDCEAFLDCLDAAQPEPSEPGDAE